MILIVLKIFITLNINYEVHDIKVMHDNGKDQSIKSNFNRSFNFRRVVNLFFRFPALKIRL